MQISDLKANVEVCKKELQDKGHQLDLVRMSKDGLEDELNTLKRKIQTYRDGYEAGQQQMNKLHDVVEEKDGRIKVTNTRPVFPRTSYTSSRLSIGTLA